MSSDFGNKLHFSLFGESHGSVIGITVDGFPAGQTVDIAELEAFLARRRPGRSAYTSARQEQDTPLFLSGITDGKTNGAPLCAIIENHGQHPNDYDSLTDIPRPSHADFGAYLKWHGKADLRGGGHFSGRLTAPLCIAGGIALQLLSRQGIAIGAHLSSAAGICDEAFPLMPDASLFASLAIKELPVISSTAARAISDAILAAKQSGDSVGGVVECAAIGLPGGLGGPLFGGLESRLSSAIFGIPAVKGVEFGSGFAGAALHGSQNNDPFIINEGRVMTSQNNAGGILGGISTGMPLVVRAAFKPTPSIAVQQRSVSLSRMEEVPLVVEGRHDPCIAVRAVPVVEAVTALVLLDLLLEEGKYNA